MLILAGLAVAFAALVFAGTLTLGVFLPDRASDVVATIGSNITAYVLVYGLVTGAFGLFSLIF
jgi:uncharacterized membrane protein YqjE